MAIAADGSTQPWDELIDAQVHVVLEPALRPKHFSKEAILQAVQAALRG
jgi:hypothetical protein